MFVNKENQMNFAEKIPTEFDLKDFLEIVCGTKAGNILQKGERRDDFFVAVLQGCKYAPVDKSGKSASKLVKCSAETAGELISSNYGLKIDGTGVWQIVFRSLQEHIDENIGLCSATIKNHLDNRKMPIIAASLGIKTDEEIDSQILAEAIFIQLMKILEAKAAYKFAPNIVNEKYQELLADQKERVKKIGESTIAAADKSAFENSSFAETSGGVQGNTSPTTINVDGSSVNIAINIPERKTTNDSEYPFGVAPRNYAGTKADVVLVDRKETLKELTEKIAKCKKPIYIYSFGGLGKSAIAKELCRIDKDYIEDFKPVFLIEASQESKDLRLTLMTNDLFGNFALESADPSKSSIASDFKRFCSEANKYTGKVLLVIDNITEQEQLSSISSIAESLDWTILVTTRIAPERLAKQENRVIDVDRLSPQDCEELFYTNYFSDELDEADKEAFCNSAKNDLDELMKICGYHTKLIEHFGKAGQYNSLTVRDLKESLQAKNFGVMDFVDEDDEYQQLHEIMASIYDIEKLDTNEKRILNYFAFLPDIRIHKDKLIEWFTNDNLSVDETMNAFKSLCKRGWLKEGAVPVIDQNGAKQVRTLECHSIAQKGILLNIPDKRAAAEGLLQGLTRFFSVEPNEDFAPLVQYFSHAWILIEHLYNIQDYAVMSFMREFLRALNIAGSTPVRTHALAEQLISCYKHLHPEKEECDIREYIDCWLLYAATCASGKQQENSQDLALSIRAEVEKLATSNLEKDDALFIRAKRSYAISLRDIGNYESAKSIFQDIIDNTNQEKILGDKTLAYQYCQALSGIGLATSGQSRELFLTGKIDESQTKMREAIELRKKQLEFSQKFFGKDSRFAASAKHDLAANYIFLYQQGDSNKKHLESAEPLILEAQQMKEDRYGSRCSITYAAGLSILAQLHLAKSNFDEAFECANECLAIRKKLSGDGLITRIGLIHKVIGKIHKTKWFELSDPTDLHLAQQAFSEAHKHLSARKKGGGELLDAKIQLDEVNKLIEELDKQQ